MQIFVSLILFLVLNLASVFVVAGENSPKSLFQAVYMLAQEHQKSLERLFRNSPDIWSGDLEKSFLKNIQFLKESSTQKFLTQIEYDIKHNKPPVAGIQYISYDKFISVNGAYKSVHYEYKYDGKHAVFRRQTDHNGHIIKAFYKYNLEQKLLEVSEFQDSQLKNRQSYKLKV